MQDAQQLAMLNKTQRNTIKRLEALKKVSLKFNKSNEESESKAAIQQQINTATSLTKSQKNCVEHSKVMQMFVLNISNLFASDSSKSLSVEWQIPILEFPKAPLYTILYSLNLGINEIVLFGGMEMESPLIQKNYENAKHRVSSRLYIMKPDALFNS